MEWINPKYAELVAGMRRAAAERKKNGDDRPHRGFVFPAVKPKG